MKNYRAQRNRKNYFSLTEKLESPLDLYEHLPFQIAVVSNLLQLNRHLAIREIAELEPRELRVVLNVGSYMPISSADIAYQSRFDAYTVSRAVKKLKQLGMIDTIKLGANKKVKYLVLTEQGQDVYDRMCTVIRKRTERLESELTSSEKETLMELLAKLEDKAEKILADYAQSKIENDTEIPADQKEIIRWRKKSCGK